MVALKELLKFFGQWQGGEVKGAEFFVVRIERHRQAGLVADDLAIRTDGHHHGRFLRGDGLCDALRELVGSGAGDHLHLQCLQ
ncbi:MAG TPA: hypothetical protein DIT64_18680 [Verrucomicrobiales bacterium]|nr:hypothetical protein [Verrucomicrobiales bacterium]